LGEAYTQSARFEDARKVLDDGLTVAAKNDDRCHQAELQRLQGELMLAQSPGQIGEAEQCFGKAIETARGQGSRAWELRATISVCRLWQRLGRNREAHDALSAVYGTYVEGFKTPDLREASALLSTMR
jgi:predicted ATPase